MLTNPDRYRQPSVVGIHIGPSEVVHGCFLRGPFGSDGLPTAVRYALDVCQKTKKAATSDPSDAQQRTCLTIRSVTDLLMIDGLICLDSVDISSVMRDDSRAIGDIGKVTDDGRAIRAIEATILDVKRQFAYDT